jgi:hypothetical protein
MNVYTTYTRPPSARAQHSRKRPIISNSSHNSSLVTRTVICPTAAKFKPPTFPVSGLAPPNAANISIFMILYDYYRLRILLTYIAEARTPTFSKHISRHCYTASLLAPRSDLQKTQLPLLLRVGPCLQSCCLVTSWSNPLQYFHFLCMYVSTFAYFFFQNWCYTNFTDIIMLSCNWTFYRQEYLRKTNRLLSFDTTQTA